MSRDYAGGDHGPAGARRELYGRGSGPGAPARPPGCRTFPFPASRSPSSVSRKRHIDPRALPQSAPRRAPQATHLGHGLPVAGHRLLDEVENFHAAISARNDHPGPPEAHGHFHAAVPRCPWPERRWAGRLYAGRGGAAAPARRRLGARAGGRTELPGYHVQPGRLRLASPVPACPRPGACSLRPPVRRLGVLARSAAARGRVALELSRDSEEGTARQGGGAAAGWAHSTARRRQEEAQGGAPRGLRRCPAARFTARLRASQPAALCLGQRGAGRVLLQPTCRRLQWEAHSGTPHPRPQRAPARSSSFLCDF